VRTNIYLNGRFIGWKVTGVGRAARELTPRLLALLANDGRFRGEILAPCNRAATALAAIQPGRNQSLAGGVLWEQILLPFRSRDGYHWVEAEGPVVAAVASPFRISITTASPCRISAYRSWPSSSARTTPREKPNARSRNSMDAVTLATAR